MSTDTPRPERVTLTDKEMAAQRVTAWLDDDEALRIPDTDWGRQLYADLRILAAREQALREEHERVINDLKACWKVDMRDARERGEALARVRDLLEVLDNSDDGGRIVWASGLEAPVSDLREGLRRALAVTEEWGETR